MKVICGEEAKVLNDFLADACIEMEIGETIKDSILNISGKKGMNFPKMLQYIIYKCFIIEFELFYSSFVEECQDIYCYTGKRIVFHENVEAVNENNIIEYLEKGRIIETIGLSGFIKKTEKINGEYCLNYN